MAIIPNAQSFHPTASGTLISYFTPSFQASMDSVIVGMGRDVTIHLPAAKANLRWTDEPFNESTRNIQEIGTPGRLGSNFLRMKTVQVSQVHIRESIGASVDGINLELFEEPRYTGFGGQLLYVISWWKVVNR